MGGARQGVRRYGRCQENKPYAKKRPYARARRAQYHETAEHDTARPHGHALRRGLEPVIHVRKPDKPKTAEKVEKKPYRYEYYPYGITHRNFSLPDI